MTQLSYHPNLNHVPEVLPAGTYTLIFEECKERISTSGEDYLTFVWRIFDGKYAGRRILDNIYCFASDPEYKAKALLKLDRLCEIFGITYLENTDLFAQKKCLGQTGNRLNSQGHYSPYIRNYWPLPESPSSSGEVNRSKMPSA